MEWRGRYLKASTKRPPLDPSNPRDESWSPREVVESMISDQARELAEQDETEADTFFAIATDQGTLLTDARDRWLNEEGINYKKQTVKGHRQVLDMFIDWIGPNTLTDVSRKKAGEFVGKELAQSGLMPKTINRYVSSLSVCWSWMVRRGLAEDNIWRGQGVKVGKNTIKRTPLIEAQLQTLLTSHTESKYDPLIHDLMRLALVTGARLEELCALRQEDISEKDGLFSMFVRDGKTENAIRTVPFHKMVTPIIRRRLTVADNYFFPGLTPGGPDRKRSWNVSKAYTRFRRKVGVDDPTTVFHAFRHTFIEAMEGAEVPIPTIQLIVGHSRDEWGETLKTYSKGSGVDLRKAVGKLDYGSKVMGLISII